MTEERIYSVLEEAVTNYEKRQRNRAERGFFEEAKGGAAGDLFDNQNIAAVVKILRSFKQDSIELFQFLRLITGQELDQLKEYVNDYDEEGVSTQTILNCVSLWDYMSEINDLVKKQMGASFPDLIAFIV